MGARGLVLAGRKSSQHSALSRISIHCFGRRLEAWMKIRARGSILRMKWKTAYLAPDKAEDERARLQYPARWYISLDAQPCLIQNVIAAPEERSR
jgi:hypothetical protein